MCIVQYGFCLRMEIYICNKVSFTSVPKTSLGKIWSWCGPVPVKSHSGVKVLPFHIVLPWQILNPHLQLYEAYKGLELCKAAYPNERSGFRQMPLDDTNDLILRPYMKLIHKSSSTVVLVSISRLTVLSMWFFLLVWAPLHELYQLPFPLYLLFFFFLSLLTLGGT